MPVVRKLVAVVVADVVGYSRLMERDEAGTHERLRTLRDELIDPKIAEHGGRTVKTSGDGMLLEFPSATSALRCAVEVQRELGARNGKIRGQGVDGPRAEKHDPLLVALADDRDLVNALGNVARLQAEQFAYSQAGGIKGFEYRAVAKAGGGARVGGVHKMAYDSLRNDLRKRAGLLGRANAFGGVDLDDAALYTVPEE